MLSALILLSKLTCNATKIFMTIFDFQLLNLNEQIDLLYHEGVYIGKRKLPDQIIVIYQFETFYAEIFYRRYRCFIDRIFCAQSTVILNPYLQQINVEELVKIC
jgi:hypothetical protein